MIRTGRFARATTLMLVMAVVMAVPAQGGQSSDARAAAGLRPPPQLATAVVPDGWPAPPAATAAAYLLLDADTGQVLAARDADRRRPVASTVKVLTALTVLQRAPLDERVPITAASADVGGASAGLVAGATWTVAELLDGLIARSGNDAATALAIHVGGSVAGFVDLMRADAAALGLNGVVLSAPSGLLDANRLSARDLATIARAAMADPRFRELAARRRVRLPGTGPEQTRNDLLLTYRGATGIKTGFTDAAGYSLIASATRDGRELIAVVLDSRTAEARFSDAAALLDHGFAGFALVRTGYAARLRTAGGWVDLHADPITVTVPTTSPGVSRIIGLPIELPAAGQVRPVTVSWEGQRLGQLDVTSSVPAPATATEGAAVGRFLVDRAYAAMRAAAATGAWRR